MSSGPADSSPSSRPSHASESPENTTQPSSDVGHGGSDPSWVRDSSADETAKQVMEVSELADGEDAKSAVSGENQDLAWQERDRSSRTTSGGFLLQPILSVRDRKRHTTRERRESGSHRSKGSANEKAERSASHSRDGTPRFNYDGATDSTSTPKNANMADDIRVEKRGKHKGKAKMRPSPPRSQTSSSVAGSSNAAKPLAEDEHHQDDTHRSASQSAVVDPSAIVRMALSLNESRRLNLAPGRLASNQSPTGRRATSGRLDSTPTSLQGHFGDHRQSLRQSMQSRDASRNASPTLGGPGSQRSRASVPQLHGPLTGPAFDQDIAYTFSSGTIARAENARKFIQLHHEYRRLLQVLPPLSPITASARKTGLGRVYNPLQYIRNRKIRGRERGFLNPEATGWGETDVVKAWVDSVEGEATMPGYRVGDIVMLPPWDRSAEKPSESCPESSAEVSGNTASGSKPKRPKLEWTFSPADLLADAYWLEQDMHKALIETRDGNKVFTRLQPENIGAPGGSRLSYESMSDNRDSYLEVAESDWKGSPVSPRQRNVPGDLVHGASTLTHHEGNLARVKRRLLTRRRTTSTTASLSSGSDDDDVDHGRSGKIALGRKLGVDIGPLERHMSAMLKSEISGDGNRETLQSNVANREEGQGRRGGVSNEHQQAESPPATPDKRPNDSLGYRSLRSSLSTDHLGSPRISVEDVDEARPYVNGYAWSPSLEVKRPKMKPRASPLDFLHKRGKSKEQNHIDENDFAVSANDTSRDIQSTSPASARSSLDSNARRKSNRMGTTLEVPRISTRSHSQDNNNVNSNSDMENGATSSTRFFKGGKIGDIVRSERSHVPGLISKKDMPRHDSVSSSKNPAGSADSSSGNDDEEHLSPLAPRRSRSTNDLSQIPSYHVKNLPTFRSTNAPPVLEEEQDPSKPEDDHIYRQLQEQRAQKRMRHSRYDKLALPSLDTSTDVSPNTSSYDLTQEARTNDSFATAESAIQSSVHSSAAVRHADQRLQKLLREPGGVGKGGLPVTGLSVVDARPTKHSRLSEGHRAMSVSETSEEPPTAAVTSKEISHVRALLLSSGVKAQALALRGNTIVDPPSEYLTQAAKTANATFSPVLRRQEHVVAARLLSNSLENAASSFEKAAAEFRSDTCHKLQARIDDLRERVNSDLTPRIRSCGDDADAFIARLTTSHTLAVKQVNDSVDLMMRSRWRRLRWLRRVGFKMLEWLLVALMWWIWLFVFVFKAFRGLLVGVVKGVRWALWF